MNMALTEHQLEKKAEVKNLLSQGYKRIRLVGSAGVGKTFLVGDLVNDFVRDYTINPNYNNGLIYITAPTNKALAILQTKVQGSSRFIFKTVHAALKMVLSKPDKQGNRKFIITKSGRENPQDFKRCKIAIIDECSMLNVDFVGGIRYDEKTGEVLEEVRGYLEDFDMPIIFIGDKKQLNPVGEPKGSPVFLKDWPEVELTEIIRQGEGNPIIDLSRDLDIIPFKIPRIIDGKGYVYDNNLAGLIDNLAEVNGTDELKYLAWINTKLNEVNRAVRERRYGTPKRIERGETLVFNAPLNNYYINKEVKVEDLDIVTDFVPVPTANTRFIDDEPINLDQVRMKYYRINNSFNVVHEHSDDMFRTVMSLLGDNCKKFGWNWMGYFWFKESLFANITYNHAITVHKSQGSTYKQAIINIKNINYNSQIEEKTRMLYTAVTRASDLVILNNVI